jgi:2-keto-4-pentenoate hydratase/2-oxohepta-3-ene-1,7-dioic acid hydratase in catechol pathway
MKIARVMLKDGQIAWASQQPDGSLLRIMGDPLFGQSKITDEKIEAASWLPPLQPRVIMCLGRNYAEHAAEGGSPPPEYPILFMKNPNAATGHMQPVRIPSVCEDEVDYEGELAVVIGREALDVPREKALDYVLGYCCADDISARIWQEKKGGSQWCRGKGFDTFAPLGPVLVTADELPNPSGLNIRTTLNGKEVQNSNTSKMIFDVPTSIAFLSQGTTLLPGTVIFTGTPQGVGWARTPKLTLKNGDTVAVEIEKVGKLTNPVVR